MFNCFSYQHTYVSPYIGSWGYLVNEAGRVIGEYEFLNGILSVEYN